MDSAAVEGHPRPYVLHLAGAWGGLPEFTRVPIAKTPGLAQALELAKTEKKFTVEKAELHLSLWGIGCKSLNKMTRPCG